MKHFYYLIILYISLAACLTSCTKESDNGDIDGMWQLTRVEGGHTDIKYTGDTADDMHYWSFHLTLLQYSKPIGDLPIRYFSHFTLTQDSLYIYDLCFPSANESETDNNEWMTMETCNEILEWGLDPIPDSKREGKVCQTFHVDLLNEQKMILSSGEKRLYFRKF